MHQIMSSGAVDLRSGSRARCPESLWHRGGARRSWLICRESTHGWRPPITLRHSKFKQVPVVADDPSVVFDRVYEDDLFGGDLARVVLKLASEGRQREVIRVVVTRLSLLGSVSVAEGGLLERDGETLWVARHGSSALIEEVVVMSEAGVLGEAARLGRSTRGRAMWAVPLSVNGSVVGSLAVGGDVSRTDWERFEELVAVTVLGLEHVAERDATAKSVMEIATVLSSLIESRDTYTESHCVALAEMSVGVGIRMGLGSEQLTVLNLAGHLHDIGKVSIPDEVLLKEGPLSAAESAVMKSHTVIGETVLSRISSFRTVAPVVGQHHERFDGTGYPSGLRGEGILLEARILAVADAFDAMTTTRPYRGALPVDVAVQEIQDGAGSQFDPDVASMFVVYLEGEEAQWNRSPSS